LKQVWRAEAAYDVTSCSFRSIKEPIASLHSIFKFILHLITS